MDVFWFGVLGLGIPRHSGGVDGSAQSHDTRCSLGSRNADDPEPSALVALSLEVALNTVISKLCSAETRFRA